ncbi:hypothetical protein E2C01_010654 [Portunus trituberculatus]|uniref:Uncharacterized protein n=1 Tax=Portunus trituberculatus TaxID=210409 RepID=A0A5B7D914_PORTR|nr:hypothetical protein [Portunus trituberculatus]
MKCTSTLSSFRLRPFSTGFLSSYPFTMPFSPANTCSENVFPSLPPPLSLSHLPSPFSSAWPPPSPVPFKSAMAGFCWSVSCAKRCRTMDTVPWILMPHSPHVYTCTTQDTQVKNVVEVRNLDKGVVEAMWQEVWCGVLGIQGVW